MKTESCASDANYRDCTAITPLIRMPARIQSPCMAAASANHTKKPTPRFSCLANIFESSRSSRHTHTQMRASVPRLLNVQRIASSRLASLAAGTAGRVQTVRAAQLAQRGGAEPNTRTAAQFIPLTQPRTEPRLCL